LKIEQKVVGENPPRESAFWNRMQNGTSPEPVDESGRADSFLMAKDDPGHGLINALRREQLAIVVVEPTMASILGQAARYQSGGEFPVPTDATGKSITWRPYGTSIHAVAKQNDTGRALVTCKVSLSEIDPSRSLKVGTFDVPSLRVYENESTFEANWGETFVLCSKQPDQKRGLGGSHDSDHARTGSS
jgi:Flp pilus assembly secretin CpaC